MNYRCIEGYDKYNVYENGDVVNVYTQNKIKPYTIQNGQTYVSLCNNEKKYSKKTLSRLIYEVYNECTLSTSDIIRFKDNDKTNFNYNNLIKIERINMFKIDEEIELDPTKEWKKIMDEYYISNYGDIFSIKKHIYLQPVGDLHKYYTIKLSCNQTRTRKSFLLHRLVYKMFNAEIGENNIIQHKDKNIHNNYIGNLIETKSSHSKCKKYDPSNIVIHQYSMDKKLIRIWVSMEEIKEKLGYNISLITSCCLNQNKTTYGYIWRFVKVNDKIIKNINQYSKDGSLLKIWKSLEEITEELNYNKYYIIECCKNNRKTTYGYIWKYDNIIVNENDKIEYNIKDEKIKYNLGYAKEIYQINLHKNTIIKKYDSMAQIFKELNKKIGNNIRLVCEGKRKSAFGYRWKFV